MSEDLFRLMKEFFLESVRRNAEIREEMARHRARMHENQLLLEKLTLLETARLLEQISAEKRRIPN